MGANIAGIYGAQIFRRDDRPLYKRGFATNIAILCVALVLASVRQIDDVLRRRRNAKLDSASEQIENEEKAARPSDVQPAPILIGEGARPVVSDAVPR